MIALFTTLKNLFGALRRGLADARFRALSYLTVIALASGTLFYWRFEDWSVVDAFYFSVITLTTVGYGDLAPTTTGTRLFTAFYVLAGLGIIVAFVATLATHATDLRVERKQGDG